MAKSHTPLPNAAVHRRDTFAELAADAVRLGAAPVIDRLRAITPPETFEPFHVIRPGAGKPSKRTTLGGDAHIDYTEYSAPDLWRPPYAVVKVQFSAEEPGDRYMTHGGEELLLPLSGSVQYQAWWSPGGKLQRVTLQEPIEPGMVIRFNPSVFHHTWAAGGVQAKAWMILRDPRSSASAVTIVPPGTVDLRARRLVPSEELGTPVEFALRGWDLGPALARCREDAGLSLRDVGYYCGVDATQLSRMESGSRSANMSLEALVRVARFLRVGLVDLIENADWFCMTDRFDHNPKAGPAIHLRIKPPGEHRIHLRVLKIASNQGEVSLDTIEDAPIMSWIVLQGSGLVTLNGRDGERLEAVSEGSVAHFRRSWPLRVEARSDLKVVEVSYSTYCRCAEGQSTRNPLASANAHE